MERADIIVTAVYIIMIIAAVIMFLSLLPIHVVFDFSYASDNNTIYVKFLFVHIKLYPKQQKLDKEEEKEEKQINKKTFETDKKLKKVKYIYDKLKKDLFKLLNYIFKKAVSIKELNISTVIGTGDPMYTGILYGTVNAAVYGALGIADSKMKIKKYHVDIRSDFDNPRFDAGVYAVTSIQIMYLYYILVKILIILRKLKKTLKEVNENE